MQQNQTIKFENIDPTKASAYLNANKSNRKLRDGVVEKYASDMKNGRWTDCPMPIVFYEDGDVADGQHRLWAIVESETTQRFPVMRGLAREAGLNIDTGLARSMVDNARISGVDSELSNELIGVCRAIEVGERQGKSLSNSARLEYVSLHRDAATWAISNGPRGRSLRNAIVLGAVGRAFYYEKDTARLRRFCDVFSSGFSDGAPESAAVAIRNYILEKGSVVGSHALWRDTFLKVQNAIKYFMQGKSLTVIKRVSDESYPLPKRKAA